MQQDRGPLTLQVVTCSGCAFISGLRMGLPGTQGMQPSQAQSDRLFSDAHGPY